jgi:hypothetical protein
VIRRAFREAEMRGENATFYIHPWEIDPGQPRLAVSPFNYVRHYRGLDTALARIETLLSEFRFASIASHLSSPVRQSPAFATVGVA